MRNPQFQFINPETEPFDKDKAMPASYIRKVFRVVDDLKKVTLHLTALGVYKAYLNGQELDGRMLLPGFTNYHAKLQYQTWDITERVRPGVNVLCVILGNGWYRGCLGITSVKAFYGKTVQLAAELVMEKEQQTEIIRTDETWKATQNGPLMENDLKTYETVDMRKSLNGWMDADYDDSGWHNCTIGIYAGECVPHEGEPVLEREHFSATVLKTPDGNTVLDFGQNLSGHVEFTVTGKSGHTVKLYMGECLDENGNFTTKNLQAEGSENFGGALGQCLTYTLKEGTQTYKSQFLISGYQYVLVQNWPEEVKAENFTSIAMYSVMQETGSFSCSNELINQFVSNSRWSWHSNTVDIPTDCPTRERAGWTGDINVFCETANFYADTRKFLHKYLGDFMTLQAEDGGLPYICPEVPFQMIKGLDTQRIPYSSAGWSDALIHIPMVLYRFYGDTENIAYVYEAAKRFMNYDFQRAKKRNWNHFYRFDKHYQYILDTGYHWGEWLEPGSVMVKDGMKALLAPDAEVATAWLYHSLTEVAEMAHILGKPEDEAKYKGQAELVRQAYRKEFLKNGKVDSKRQCQYVRPLAMGLADSDEGKVIAKQLNDMVVANGYKIGTGFLTTYKVLFILCDYGYVDTAYMLLENEECPGWLYEVKKGATTTWENWLGVDENNKPTDSLNHYAPGANIAWLYEYCAGIRLESPGFEKIKIQPVPGGSLTWARAEYSSIKGKIVSAWKIKDGIFTLSVEAPKDIETTVRMPDGTEYRLENGNAQFTCDWEG